MIFCNPRKDFWREIFNLADNPNNFLPLHNPKIRRYNSRRFLLADHMPFYCSPRPAQLWRRTFQKWELDHWRLHNQEGMFGKKHCLKVLATKQTQRSGWSRTFKRPRRLWEASHFQRSRCRRLAKARTSNPWVNESPLCWTGSLCETLHDQFWVRCG